MVRSCLLVGGACQRCVDISKDGSECVHSFVGSTAIVKRKATSCVGGSPSYRSHPLTGNRFAYSLLAFGVYLLIGNLKLQCRFLVVVHTLARIALGI